MTKEYNDREIVEYLDESVVWHEIVESRLAADIIFFKNKYKGYAKTPTLALRGAICMLIESEEK